MRRSVVIYFFILFFSTVLAADPAGPLVFVRLSDPARTQQRLTAGMWARLLADPLSAPLRAPLPSRRYLSPI